MALVATEEFAGLAAAELEALGSRALPLVLVAHPFGDRGADEIAERARAAFSAIVAALTTPAARLTAASGERSYPEPRSVAQSKPLFAVTRAARKARDGR